MLVSAFISFGLLIGCPDPNASSSGTNQEGATTGSAVGNTGSQETDPSAARLTCTKDGENCLEISGQMVYTGESTGSIRVDVQKVREGSAPMLVHTLELQSAGDFSFYAPKGYGKIIVTAFIDEAGDGPSPKDPQGRAQLDVQEEALTGLSIEVKSDNAPVMPKPPEDPQKDNQNGEKQPAPDGAKPEQAPSEDKPADPPADNGDGPPADE